MKWLVVGALVGLLAVPAAVGAAPAFQERNADSFADPDSCGTGEEVLVELTEVVNGWVGTTGGDPTQVKLTVNFRAAFTNPATGATVVEHWAFRSTNEITEGVEEGPHTHVFVENGLKASLTLVGGGVITRDAGSLGYAISFDDEDNVTDFEVLWMRGPHPSFPEFDFCGLVTEALGIS